jgi:hypothetical protein
MISFSIKAAVAGLPTDGPWERRRRRGRRRGRDSGNAEEQITVMENTDLRASFAAAHDVEFMVRKLVYFEVSFGIVHSDRLH